MEKDFVSKRKGKCQDIFSQYLLSCLVVVISCERNLLNWPLALKHVCFVKLKLIRYSARMSRDIWLAPFCVCLCGVSAGTTTSSNSPKTCMLD